MTSLKSHSVCRWLIIWSFCGVNVWWCSSGSQSCQILCNPVDRSPPGLPVHHQLPGFTQTHVHRVGDAIQPSHPLSSPSPPAFSLSQHHGKDSFPVSQIFESGGQSIGASASASVLPMPLLLRIFKWLC